MKIKPVTILKHPKYPLVATAAVAAAGVAAWVVPPPEDDEICVEVWEESETVEREPITTMGIIAPYPRDKSSRKPVIEPRLPEGVAEPSAPPVPEVDTLPEPEVDEPEAGAEEQEKSAAP